MSIQHLRNQYSSELFLRRLKKFHGAHSFPMPALIAANPLVENYKRLLAARAQREAVLLKRSLARCISKAQKIRVAVCHEFGVTPEELMGQSHSPRYAFPRQVAMHLTKMHAGKRDADVARLFGRDHTSVRLAHRKVPSLAAVDPRLAQRLTTIKNLLEAA